MIRVLYKKTGDISYISHLDIVKLMERVSRRAGIKLSYSQGFSPHPKTSFSPALSVGMHRVCKGEKNGGWYRLHSCFFDQFIL